MKKILGNPISVKKENDYLTEYVFSKDILVYTNTKSNIVVTIRFFNNSKMRTSKGIAIGDSNTKMLDAYGKCDVIINVQDIDIYNYYSSAKTGGLRYAEMLFHVERKTGKILAITYVVGNKNDDKFLKETFESTP